jgi:hypothetical protein
MTVDVAGRSLKTDFAPRAVRKVLSAVEEHGAEGVVVLIQGNLAAGDNLIEAGLVAQMKKMADGEKNDGK